MSELAGQYPDRDLAVELDVTKPDQRASEVERCQDHFGPIDVLVNSAGIDFWGAIEEQDETAYRATGNTNDVLFLLIGTALTAIGTGPASKQHRPRPTDPTWWAHLAPPPAPDQLNEHHKRPRKHARQGGVFGTSVSIGGP